MVSFHTPLSPTRRKAIPELENSSKKRKWEEPQAEEELEKPLKAKSMKSIFHKEIHLGTHLPSLDWQQCLDIKSGQIQYYNTNTQKSRSNDPRMSQEPPKPGHMSLDLELNLPCGSLRTHNHNDHNFMTKHYSGSSSNNSSDPLPNHGENTVSSRRLPWLASEGDQRDMVTAVCKKCHMLVMMYKSSPACPNCKFMHPPDQSPSEPKLSLLC